MHANGQAIATHFLFLIFIVQANSRGGTLNFKVLQRRVLLKQVHWHEHRHALEAPQRNRARLQQVHQLHRLCRRGTVRVVLARPTQAQRRGIAADLRPRQSGYPTVAAPSLVQDDGKTALRRARQL